MSEIKIIFVCLGNICRSPLAEGIFREQVVALKLDKKIRCDSAGTSNYHIGQNPDQRTAMNALSNGLQLSHKGQQFSPDHFDIFDYIIAMDQSNYEDIMSLWKGEGSGNYQLLKMRQFDNEGVGLDVPDPYYGGERGFQEVYDILYRSSENFLKHVIKESNLVF